MNAKDHAAGAALNRFGLGARPGDIERLTDPRGWLVQQTSGTASNNAAFVGLPDSLAYLQREAQLIATRRQFKQSRREVFGAAAKTDPDDTNGKARNAALKSFREEFRDDLFAEAAARYRVAATTATPFTERLVHFWSNHFSVSLDKGPARLYAAPMEREAIRPHVNGRFSDMLLAVETHPAMLRYLDNVQSVGPDSRAGEFIERRLARKGEQDKGRAGGLNENLGREIMELHTLGVDGGYTQADVTELARAITGWSTPLPRDFGGAAKAGHRRAGDAMSTHTPFVFRANAHEPGTRTVLGKRYAQSGVDQGRAILVDLAHHPATARHLALQLATHFVSDAPPPALVARMARAYLDHDTDLTAVYRVLIDADEAWGADARKFKTPQDFVVSALRAGNLQIDARPRALLDLLDNMGEPMFTPRSPAGFPDLAANWLDGDALWKRVQAAQALAQRRAIDAMPPLELAQSILGSRLDAEIATAIRRAESRQAAVATLFASPAFQWRV